MLQEVLESIHNYFIQRPNPGTYRIESGVISPMPKMKEGQRFWIVGSYLNDGVYTYKASGIMDDDAAEQATLQDEVFSGTICALAVPPAVLSLSGEIAAWQDKNGAAAESPYQSETVIGVYSYTKAASASGDGNVSWRDVFGKRLNRWRRIAL